MMSESRWRSLACAVISLLFFLHPDLYPYGPVLSVLAIGALHVETPGEGLRLASHTAVLLIPLSVVGTLLVGYAPLFIPETGIAVLIESMDGSGPTGPLFYLIISYVITIYALIVGGVTGVLVSFIKTTVRTGLTEVVPRGGEVSDQNKSDHRPLSSGLLASPVTRSLTLALAAVSAVGLFWWKKGFYLRLKGDATAFSGRCARLSSTPLDWFTSTKILRTTFQTPYCGVYEVGGVRGWIFLQIVLWAATCVVVYRAGVVLFENDTVGLVAGAILVPLWETFRFAIRPQDDLFLVFLLAVTLYVFAQDYQNDGRDWTMLLALTVILFAFTKPLATPIALGLLGLKGIEYAHQTTDSLQSPKVVLFALLAGSLVTVLIAIWLPNHLHLAHTMNEIDGGGSMMEAWGNGVVVTHHSNPTFHYLYEPRSAASALGWIAANADHLVIMGFFKSAMFFVPVLSRWSTFHILVNAVTLFPLFLMSAAGTRRLLSRSRFRIAGILLVPIIMNVVTVSVFYLDGGFNWRIPSSLSIALLSGYWLRSVMVDYRLLAPVRSFIDRL